MKNNALYQPLQKMLYELGNDFKLFNPPPKKINYSDGNLLRTIFFQNVWVILF